jgi:hypothetical protein
MALTRAGLTRWPGLEPTYDQLSAGLDALARQVDQTDPQCPIGMALTRAGLTRWPGLEPAHASLCAQCRNQLEAALAEVDRRNVRRFSVTEGVKLRAAIIHELAAETDHQLHPIGALAIANRVARKVAGPDVVELTAERDASRAELATALEREERNNEALQSALAEALNSALIAQPARRLSRGQVGEWIRQLPNDQGTLFESDGCASSDYVEDSVPKSGSSVSALRRAFEAGADWIQSLVKYDEGSGLCYFNDPLQHETEAAFTQFVANAEQRSDPCVSGDVSLPSSPIVNALASRSHDATAIVTGESFDEAAACRPYVATAIKHLTSETYDEVERKATASCSCGWECVYAIGGTYAIGYINTPNAARRCARVAALYHRREYVST